MTTAERIKNRRIELGMTQAELAEKIGAKDKSTISKIEKKGNEVSLKDIIRIASALQTTPKYLLGFGDEDIFEIISEKELPPDIDPYEYDDPIEIYKDAKKITELYLKASPDIRKAVDILLKSEQQ